jgi:putative transferase (TIGR04331 family)
MEVKKKILVTTALDLTWGDPQEEIVFLGEWCKRYSMKNLWSSREHRTIDYHWANRKKLAIDHAYLESLNEELIKELTSFLNQYHSLNKSESYWRIIIGPWLLIYISVIWDRWEAISSAINLNEKIETYFIRDALLRSPPKDFVEFREAHDSDIWNHSVFAEIIENRSFNNIKTKIINIELSKKFLSSKIKLTFRQRILRYFALKVDACLQFFSSNDQEILFFHTYFPRKTLIYFYLKLKVLPRWHALLKEPFEYTDSKDRTNLKFEKLISKNRFEKYLFQNIFKDIPIAYLEDYKSIKERTKKLVNAKKIFTANAYIANEVFKIWSAEQTSLGAKLIISAHGGAFYPLFNNFDLEDKIADCRIVWGQEWLQTQTRMPPNKLHYKAKDYQQESNVLFVDYETTRYGFRCFSVPVGPLVLEVFNQNKIFLESLDTKILKNLKVRPKALGSWETKQRYIDQFGKDIITNESTILKDFESSRIVICCYPQTSFAESMYSGIPSILLLKKGIWECQSIYDELFLELEEAKILHFDPQDAAKHIAHIYESPELWWDSQKVLSARKKFEEICLTITDNPKDNWVNFFKNIDSK